MEESTKLPNLMIFGIHPVLEAIKAEKTFDKILLQEKIDAAVTRQIKDYCKEHVISLSEVPKEKLNRITGKNHQGIIAFLSPIEFYDVDDIVEQKFSEGVDPFILVLDKITDVRNFGAICRTAECAGVHAIVIPKKSAAQISEDSIKTSAGALMTMPICKVRILTETVKHLKDRGLRIVSCTEKTDDLHTAADLSGPIAIVMGSEEIGISREIVNISDNAVKLPMLGTIESLNVSVACGILLYEVIRQRTLV
jgi:23S rRNA (guanosine2251-2'-O)-methyltransferase